MHRPSGIIMAAVIGIVLLLAGSSGTAQTVVANNSAPFPDAAPLSIQPQSTNCDGGAADGLVADDGTIEDARGNLANLMVQAFTIPAPAYTFSQLCVCLTAFNGIPDDPAAFDIVFHSSNSGVPGGLVASVSTTASAIPQFPAGAWYNVATDLTLVGGEYFVGVDLTGASIANPVNFGICGDDAQNDENNFYFINGGQFAESNMDYMVRMEGAVNACPDATVANLGLVMLTQAQAIVPYGLPGLERQAFALPADADRNGFDTYIVGKVEIIDDDTWLGLFVGGCNLVYVPYDAVTVLTAIDGVAVTAATTPTTTVATTATAHVGSLDAVLTLTRPTQ